VKVYRVMKVGADGKPLVGTRRNMLGVRPTDPNNRDPRRKFDVAAVNGGDLVIPGAAKGLSVSTAHAHLVCGRDEVIWELDAVALPADLTPVADGKPHYVLEPSQPMTLDQYQAALLGTRDSWTQVT